MKRLLLSLTAVVIILSSCREDGDPSPNNYIIDGPQDQYPSFSPDGSHIVYCHNFADVSDPKGYPDGIYIIDKDGNDRKLVLAGTFQSPAWSPSGDWLVFSLDGSIYKSTIAGEQVARFTGLDSLEYPGTYFPSWSKDGRSILFDKALNPGYGMYRTSPEFKGVEALFDLVIVGREPELAADESSVVYTRGGTGIEHTEIFKASLIDKVEVQLTNNKRDNRFATWSRDGKKIAWSTNLELYVMNDDGTDQKRIGYGSDPSWSPLNDIVFSHANDDYSKEVLFITKLDGSTIQITF